MCDCLDKVNDILEKEGFEIEGIYKGFGLELSKENRLNAMSNLCVAVRKLPQGKGKKRETKSMVLNYCPFCGKKAYGE